MDDMSTFTQVWKNYERYSNRLPAKEEMTWINELNQAAFTQFEKRLPKHIKVRAVELPSFLYYVEAAGGYGVERYASTVTTYNVLLPTDATFELRVEATVQRLLQIVLNSPDPGTVFFYTPVVPHCLIDWINGHDGPVGPNRRMLGVRLRVLGHTVDV